MATTLAYNLANLALSTSNASNVNVAVFAGNVSTIQYINAGNIQTSNLKMTGSLVFADGSSLTSVTNAISVYDYTGDGVTTTFATGNYNATTTLDTNVYISGVYQRKSTYSWTGTNIIFTGAPPVNSAIEIVINTYATGIAVPNDGSVYPAALSTGGPYWNASGYLGLNTTSPLNNLDIRGGASITSTLNVGSTVRVSLLVSNGSVTGTTIIPSGSSAPTNGMYLPAANTLGFATNSTQVLTIDSGGSLGIGTTNPSNYGKLAVFGGNLYLNSAQISTPSGTGNVAVQGVSTNIVQASAQTVSAVTAVNFTGIPSWVRRITIMLSGLAVSSGTPNLTMRIGAGAYDATSYNSIASRNITTTTNANTSTSAFVLNVGTAGTYYGSIVLTNVTGNIWALSSILADPSNSAINMAAGTHTTSAALSQLQLIMSDGTSTLTGTVNILYE